MKNIFLIGMPSSGKTTLGKELARHIRYRFLDTDRIIVKNEGQDVKQIFKHKGELFFRELEKKTLHDIRPDSKLIVSTGGGMPCFFDNMDYIKQNGISVFLNVPIETIYQRIYKHSTNDRPLLDKTSTDIMGVLEEKYQERLQFYSRADFVFDGVASVHDILKFVQSVV